MSTATVTELEHEIGSTGRLVLHVRSTGVRLRGVDGGSVRIRGRGEAPLHGVDVDPGPGQVTIAVRSGRAPDLEIDVPTVASVTAEGSSADIEARGLHGEQRYRSASGDLRLLDVRGSITAEAVSGDVDIVADGLASMLARTVSGELSIRAATLEALRATTTSGDVRVAARFVGAGPFGIETVSGDVVLAPAGGARILASTITGDVRSDRSSRQDGPRGQRSLVIDDGGPTVTFRSMSGDLRVVRALRLAPATATTEALERTRLDILRTLERGDIDIDEAGRRLEALDEPSHHLETDHG